VIRARWDYNTEIDLKRNWLREFELNSSVSQHGLMTGSCEQDNNPCGSVKEGESLDIPTPFASTDNNNE
jgi:hypothetical protein